MCIRDRKQTDQQGARLFMSKKINETRIGVSPHDTLNTTKETVVCFDLLNCTEEEITTELAPQGVLACQRLTVRREGQTLPLAPMS